jgi:signal transduction histidine kinase
MRKTKISVFVIAVVTGMVLICFQLYWLRNTFEINRLNFVKTASNDLQKSVNNYTLEQNDHMLKLSVPDSSLSVFVTDSTPDNKTKNKWTAYKAGLSPVNLESFKIIMSGMLSQVANNPMATSRIKTLYQAELKKDGIGLGFQFIVLPDTSRTYPGSIRALLGITSDSPILVAEFQDRGVYLLKENLPNVIVSACLIALIVGCLWYLNAVIIGQARLQRLQTQFIDNMAHEFRTPLAILISTHEALNEFGELEDREKALRYIRANQSVLKKLDGNLDRMLKMGAINTRRPKPRIETVDLPVLLRQILDRYAYRQDVQVTLSYTLDTTEVPCDRFYLDTIVSNLVDNAYKYVSDKPEIDISVSPAADAWRLKITDNGPGIAKKDLAYIFDRFYRVAGGNVHDNKGYGLGLSYVRELMLILGGEISVKSALGEGTTFILQFPKSWTK